MEGIDNSKDDQYIPMAQQAISVMYQLADRPDDLAIELCKKLANKLAAKPRSVVLLRRIFAVVGHIAVGQVNNYSYSNLENYDIYYVTSF